MPLVVDVLLDSPPDDELVVESLADEVLVDEVLVDAPEPEDIDVSLSSPAQPLTAKPAASERTNAAFADTGALKVA